MAGVATAGGAAIVLMILFGGSSTGLPPPPRNDYVTEAANSVLTGDFYGREAVDALQRHYPDQHRQLVAEVREGARDAGEFAARQRFAQFIRRFLQVRIAAVGRAPDEKVNAIAEAHLALLQSLERASVLECARFADRGMISAELQAPDQARQIGHIIALQIEAVKEGEQAPATPTRSAAELDEASAAWVAELQRIRPQASRLMENEETLMRAPPEERCELAVAIHQAALALPDRQTAAVMAESIQGAWNTAPGQAGGSR